MADVEVDPELLGWVREFAQKREPVTIEDVERQFFPGDPNSARAYMNHLPRGRGRPPGIHKDCTHPKTLSENEKCRQLRGYGPSPDYPEKQRQGKWGHFADGQVRELTAEQIQELGYDTVTLFTRSLQNYARGRGLKFSMAATQSGVKFCMGVGPLSWKASSHADCDHPLTPRERDKCRQRRGTT
ncbi:hypothetical protein [Streptomyces sp. OP7]|uniref:hypothetical protein n=1 Tax=Streptomyces sp. OP7 TaxID=3142462 RepID=UPI0032E935FE